MWMRDAVLTQDFPSLRDLTTTNKYFPYRYGQAFWASVAGLWGDDMVKPLFLTTAKFGYEMAVVSVLGYDEKVVSSMWKLRTRSEEHTSELQSLMRISYAVFCLKKKK